MKGTQQRNPECLLQRNEIAGAKLFERLALARSTEARVRQGECYDLIKAYDLYILGANENNSYAIARAGEYQVSGIGAE